MDQERQKEISKYVEAYKDKRYRMGLHRQSALSAWLKEEGRRGSSTYLDVGCGRGESLLIAKRLGFHPVTGTEVVPDLVKGQIVFAEGHDLPFDDDSFHVVTCLDVFEHLLPMDAKELVTEVGRVARNSVLFSASNIEEVHGKALGLGSLHINRLPYNVIYHAMWDWLGDKFNVRYRADLSDGTQMFYEWTRRATYDMEQMGLA